MYMTSRIGSARKTSGVLCCIHVVFWATHIQDTPTGLEENYCYHRRQQRLLSIPFSYIGLEVMSVTEELAAANIAFTHSGALGFK